MLHADQNAAFETRVIVLGVRAQAREAKLAPRLTALNALRQGELPAATKAVSELWREGRQPGAVRIRRGYYRHATPRPVVSERKPLPRAERPLAAQMIDPRGIALKTHLLLLFAAHCQAAERAKWRPAIPVEPEEGERYSWMGLMAAHAASTEGRGIQVRSSQENKAIQIVSAMTKLRRLGLLQPRAAAPGPYRRIELLRENGESTEAAPTPYTVPTSAAAGGTVEVPLEFFTQGWVYLLTPSEIVSYLMWLDVAGNLEGAGFVTGAERAGHFGLGREAYESHQHLEAFCLISVERPAGRHQDGKFDFEQATESGSAKCHRVTVESDGLARPADEIIADVLGRYSATGFWSRPLTYRT